MIKRKTKISSFSVHSIKKKIEWQRRGTEKTTEKDGKCKSPKSKHSMEKEKEKREG
jgi:hypothetical protein